MRVNTRHMRNKILRLCKLDPTLADDDKRLIANIWYDEGWRDPLLYENLKKVSSPETIRRTRAKLREEGKIKSSKELDDARFNEMSQVREDLGY